MTLPDICPACSTELPPDYPHDHVAIDRALTGSAHIFHTMTEPAKQETVRVGLARGIGTQRLSRILRVSPETILHLRGTTDLPVDVQVQRMHKQGMPDTVIAVTLDLPRKKVAAIRGRHNLPALYGPGGRPTRSEAGVPA